MLPELNAARLADQARTLTDAELRETLAGWLRWRRTWHADYLSHAGQDVDRARDFIDGAFDVFTTPLVTEARRRRQPKATGPRLSTPQLLARYPDRLRPAGADRWRAACPWHADARPSLVVYGDGHCHCYACGAHRPVADLAAAWAARAGAAA